MKNVLQHVKNSNFNYGCVILMEILEQETIILGYACINIELKEHDILVNRSFKLKEFDKGIDETIAKAKMYALQNLEDMRKIIIWNELLGIKMYRMSSDMFPHIINEAAPKRYSIRFARKKLRNIGILIKKYGHRVSFHPGQYNQLGAIDKSILRKTFKDLNLHAEMLDCMELDYNSVIIVHGGGIYGDKAETLSRLETNIGLLPDNTRNRLCLENDEFSYGVTDLLPLCEKLNLKFCLIFFTTVLKMIQRSRKIYWKE